MAWLIPRGPWHDFLFAAVLLCMPYYVYCSMRRVNGQGCLLTLGKLVVLAGVYAVSSLVMLVVTPIYSVATL